MVNHRAARSGLSSGTHAGRGAFPQGYMRTGATPPKAAGASDTVPDTGADTPRSPNRASGQKGGVAPVLSLSAGAVRVVRSRTKNPNGAGENWKRET